MIDYIPKKILLRTNVTGRNSSIYQEFFVY